MIKFITICFCLVQFYYFCFNKICSLKQLNGIKSQASLTATFRFGHYMKTTIDVGLEKFVESLRVHRDTLRVHKYIQ